MLRSLGLGGDGDEIDAIQRVEREFQINFSSEDWEGFVTVGDVWRALLVRLGLNDEEAAPLRDRFVALLGEETLADDELDKVGSETVLIGGIPIGEFLRNAVRRLLRR